MPPITRSLLARILAAGLCLALAGCIFPQRKPAPTPIPGIQTLQAAATPGKAGQPGGGVVTATPPQAVAQANPTQAAAPGEATAFSGAAGAGTGAAGETPEATPSAGCPMPDGWVIHSVRQDETLYYLATSTGVSVEQVMEANCLTSDLINVGQPVALPAIPPARPTFPPARVAVVATPGCGSPFTCLSDLPPLPMPPGIPNEPGFTPCNTVRGGPWIDTFDDKREIGERFFFYACEFPMPLNANEARVFFPDGSWKKVDLLSQRPDPELKMHTAQAMIDWPALPDHPTIDYTVQPPVSYQVQIQGADGTPKQVPFFVDPPTRARILVTPLSNPPGDPFQVYYINFDPGDSLTANLHHRYADASGTKMLLQLHTSWPVTFDRDMPGSSGKRWTVLPLSTLQTDPRATYMIEMQDFQYAEYFWIK